MKKRNFGKLALVCFGIGCVFAFAIAAVEEEGTVTDMLFLAARVCLGASYVFFMAWLVQRWKAGAGKRAEKRQEKAARKEERRKRREEYHSPEQREKRAMAAMAAKNRSLELKASREQDKALDKKPIKATVVTTKNRTKKSILSATGRGLAGGLIAGPIGAVIGGATASSFVAGQEVTFAIEYASGRKGTETVEVGSRRFEEIAKVLV